MKQLVLAIAVLLLPFAAMAQPGPGASEGTTSYWDQWLEDNIDSDVLKAVRQLDQERVRRMFTELQQAMQGTNLYQLATLHETASQLAPLLQKYEATAPYGVWLQAQLDYMDAAENMQREMKAHPPKAGASVLSAAPSLKLQRQVWVRELARRPWPALAQTYVPRLKPIFAAEKTPPELVWVAEVESSFDPRARSPAGAAGMFQLMPQTARAEQLSLWPWDERLQPDKSARAAARCLRRLHDHYDDWQLALAAYNVGEGRVDKLLKQHKAHTFEAISRWLPAETQMYVPRVEATIQRREGRALKDLRVSNQKIALAQTGTAREYARPTILAVGGPACAGGLGEDDVHVRRIELVAGGIGAERQAFVRLQAPRENFHRTAIDGEGETCRMKLRLQPARHRQ